MGLPLSIISQWSKVLPLLKWHIAVFDVSNSGSRGFLSKTYIEMSRYPSALRVEEKRGRLDFCNHRSLNLRVGPLCISCTALFSTLIGRILLMGCSRAKNHYQILFFEMKVLKFCYRTSQHISKLTNEHQNLLSSNIYHHFCLMFNYYNYLFLIMIIPQFINHIHQIKLYFMMYIQ